MVASSAAFAPERLAFASAKRRKPGNCADATREKASTAAAPFSEPISVATASSAVGGAGAV